MNVRKMQEFAQQNRIQLDKGSEMALRNGGAITVCDGNRRWLENGQVIEFITPSFNGTNAEFYIRDQSGQSIWFTQLSRTAMAEDLKTPMYSVIRFKGEEECRISDRFKNARAFWETVKNRSFSVKEMGVGFVINTYDEKTKRILGRLCSFDSQKAERMAFDLICSGSIEGSSNVADVAIKKYPIYALTEL